MNMGVLDGKVAIVTGSGQGIGRAEVMLLAEQGAAVVVNDMGAPRENPENRYADTVVAEIKAAGGRAVADYGDVSNWKAAEQMVQKAIDSFGSIDILVCNAGIVRDRMLYNLTEQDWDDVVRVHMKGSFAPTHFAANYWRLKNKSTGQPANGRIIYTTSTAALFGHMGQANYSAAKAGLTGLCFTAAQELAKFGVTVNTISPRGRTQMNETAFGKIIRKEGFDDWDPENVAPWIAFLGSDMAANISGQVFGVYGGIVRIMNPWSMGPELNRNSRWTVEEFKTEARKLFPDLVAHPPKFPEVALPPVEKKRLPAG
jgi:NAD(P)-dependent dehydrogenase (short-subunit alcohol dehydrogenase family)